MSSQVEGQGSNSFSPSGTESVAAQTPTAERMLLLQQHLLAAAKESSNPSSIEPMVIEEFMGKVTSASPVDIVTYNRAMNILAKSGFSEGVKIVFNFMGEHDVDPNTMSYGLLCKSLVALGNTAEIQHVMHIYEANGGELNEFFYASLISACLEAFPPDRRAARQAFFDMAERGLDIQRVKKLLKKVLGPDTVAELLKKLGGKTGDDDASAADASAGFVSSRTPSEVQQPPYSHSATSVQDHAHGDALRQDLGLRMDSSPTRSTYTMQSLEAACGPCVASLENLGSSGGGEELSIDTALVRGQLHRALRDFPIGGAGAAATIRDRFTTGEESPVQDTMEPNAVRVDASVAADPTRLAFNWPVDALTSPPIETSVTILQCFEL